MKSNLCRLIHTALFSCVFIVIMTMGACTHGPQPTIPLPIDSSDEVREDPFIYGTEGDVYTFSFVGANILEVTRTRGPILEYLSRKVGARFRLDYRHQYDEIIDSLVGGSADFAWLGPKTYIAVRRRVTCRPVVRILRNGVGYYEGVILVRRDDGIASLEDLRGARIGFIDRSSTSGYLYPMWWFRREGITPASFFGAIDFAGTHSNALLRLVNGIYDAICTERDILIRSRDKLDLSNVDVLLVTGRIPNGPIAVRKEIDDAFVSHVEEALLTMRHDPAGRALLDELEATTNFTGFGPVSASVYDEIEEVFLSMEES